MGMTSHAKVVIIGSGPAGYTAAIYAARAMLEPVLIQGVQPGGQLTITTDVENYPGFADVIQGPWLMEQMQKQAEHVGTRIVTDHVNKVELARRPFRLECDSGDVYFDIERHGRLPDYRLLPRDVKPGELLALLNSGAYSLAQMFPYNGRPLPAAVMVREDGRAELIRKRDTYEDLLTNDIWY